MANLHPLNPRASLFSDSNLDVDWLGDFEDFSANSDVAPVESDPFCEDPLAELNIYNADEDVSSWGFDRLYNDSQWQQSNLTLLGSSKKFTSPLPGPT